MVGLQVRAAEERGMVFEGRRPQHKGVERKRWVRVTEICLGIPNLALEYESTTLPLQNFKYLLRPQTSWYPGLPSPPLLIVRSQVDADIATPQIHPLV